MAVVRVGTCSFADEAMVKYWYPPGLPPRERLRYYAEHFSTVEVDSTFYRIPPIETVRGWSERTPSDFVVHVKAFALLTRHSVRLEQLPPPLREGVPVDDRGRVERPSGELRAEAFRVFRPVGPCVSQGPRRYSVTAFLTRAWTQLARDGVLATKLGPATGLYQHNGSILYWAFPPGPEAHRIRTWADFATDLGLSPYVWTLPG